jgi:hypothetical protein
MLASILQKARSASAAEQQEEEEEEEEGDERLLPQTTHEPRLQAIGPRDPGIRLISYCQS